MHSFKSYFLFAKSFSLTRTTCVCMCVFRHVHSYGDVDICKISEHQRTTFGDGFSFRYGFQVLHSGGQACTALFSSLHPLDFKYPSHLSVFRL